MKIKITDDDIDAIGVVRAAVLDGYGEDEARRDIRAVYLLGMIHATESMKAAYIPTRTPIANAVNKRLKQLRSLYAKEQPHDTDQ